MPLNISGQKSQHKSVIQPLISLSLLVALFIFQVILRFQPSHSSVLGAISDLNPTDIISLTNLQRQEAGLEPLRPNEKLAQAAQAKAQDMFINEYWDHYSPSDNPPWTFILDAGYDYHFAGENLAKDYNDPIALVDAWMGSEAHKENILNNDYQDIGIAIVSGTLNDKETVLIVQMFGKEFTPQDYAEAIQRQTSASSGISAGLNQPSLSLNVMAQDFFSNRFLATKMFTLSAMIMLLFYVGFQLGKPKKTKHHGLRQQHWGHLLLILTLSILAWITRDGNIL